jgi:hypothetical protein
MTRQELPSVPMARNATLIFRPADKQDGLSQGDPTL